MYEEISGSKWVELSSRGILSFTEKEIEFIRSKTNRGRVRRTVVVQNNGKEIYLEYKIGLFSSNKIGTYFFKLDDSWFVAYKESKYYKCDDIIGLESFIKDFL
jgi:hypothetical protein